MENIELKTHLKFNPKFGRLVELNESSAKVILETTEDMAVDEEGLVHGGFTFGAADFCAMATVNEPYVVLVKATNCEFLAPVKVGDTVEFVSEILMKEKRKVEVKVVGTLNEIKVFEGIFSCVILDNHVLKKKKK
ncbi:hotdog domain-containing protein [Caminibacter pacificus]|jgi:acyl-coenzyme A thioesterase PaaI-like protein|uniref:Acyl-coenzyme A thioesterase PaaI-like protein n=1 Tax=Caminibacter pacificus TaxID=1424653 RepID=A0AAJ4RD73_9BACT|nr:hotdog domain-containing protein [Caminibacter pacificus]NPA87556.1 PaaI family thioesterase [Campylobacterota bacterium]QCI27591.1 PaaI family thioesterase [Caminibacter pacificus]ROR40231.1 acyl-coenzyme A thioesterase PaaI-like protein [Caminibacter pacificus]